MRVWISTIRVLELRLSLIQMMSASMLAELVAALGLTSVQWVQQHDTALLAGDVAGP